MILWVKKKRAAERFTTCTSSKVTKHFLQGPAAGCSSRFSPKQQNRVTAPLTKSKYQEGRFSHRKASDIKGGLNWCKLSRYQRKRTTGLCLSGLNPPCESAFCSLVESLSAPGRETGGKAKAAARVVGGLISLIDLLRRGFAGVHLQPNALHQSPKSTEKHPQKDSSTSLCGC